MNRGFFLDHPSISFNARGELVLAGLTATELALRFGTPLVVLLEDVIRANCRRYRSRLALYPRSKIYFASKAFLSTGFCRLLQQEKLGLDVVSSGELATALAAGFPPADIVMHGNAKSEAELQMALDAGVSRIVIDNHADIERLGRLVRERAEPSLRPNAGADGTAPIVSEATRTKVLLRVAPGIKPETHEYIQTGQIDSKFGFNLEDGSALAAGKAIVAMPGLELVGIHCHIGSRILDEGAFIATARVMLGFYAKLQQAGAPLDELNIGGGLGIRYQPGDQAPDINEHLLKLTRAVLDVSAELGIEPPVLCDEPGRSIIGEAGVNLYTVQSIKRIPGVRNYAGLDGGMTDNPRFALYGARHYCMRANDAPEARGEVGSELWSLSGKCCETGDMLARDVAMPPLEAGDLVAMLSTGAYTYSMASNYNRVSKPAVVLAGENGAALLCRREQPEEVARYDEVPAWLVN